MSPATDAPEKSPAVQSMGTVPPVDEPRVEVALARIEGKLDLLSHTLNTVSTELIDHEIRIRDLEKRPVITPKALMGALTAVSLVVGTAASALVFWS